MALETESPMPSECGGPDVHLLAPSGIAERASLTSNFLKRKMAEYEALKVEFETLKSEIDIKNGDEPNAA